MLDGLIVDALLLEFGKQYLGPLLCWQVLDGCQSHFGQKLVMYEKSQNDVGVADVDG
ncbi:MAG: hypothetical protein ACD_62C00361G0002 [uncultured bacterium]|nr:MAG: hypothetical protein ACD_62C00361G0002 [uncultured bacterium]